MLTSRRRNKFRKAIGKLVDEMIREIIHEQKLDKKEYFRLLKITNPSISYLPFDDHIPTDVRAFRSLRKSIDDLVHYMGKSVDELASKKH